MAVGEYRDGLHPHSTLEHAAGDGTKKVQPPFIPRSSVPKVSRPLHNNFGVSFFQASAVLRLPDYVHAISTIPDLAFSRVDMAGDHT
jgi:hypothetical protein